MKISSSPLKDCYLIEPRVIEDSRGYFLESFNQKVFMEATGIDFSIVQENQSKSKKNVLRGLHFQDGKSAQSKIVRVLSGEVLDVVVDLRKSSPTFGKHYKQVLSADNKLQIYVPKGFAHGFLILSEEAEFFYGIDYPYDPAAEKGLLFNDPLLKIDWTKDESHIICSERDQSWPLYDPNHTYFG